MNTLNSLGYKYSGRDGVIKVSKESLIVMKGNKVYNIYFLQGSTVIGSIVVSSSNDLDLDTTQLQHMHWLLSESGMAILSKLGLLYN